MGLIPSFQVGHDDVDDPNSCRISWHELGDRFEITLQNYEVNIRDNNVRVSYRKGCRRDTAFVIEINNAVNQFMSVCMVEKNSIKEVIKIVYDVKHIKKQINRLFKTNILS